MPSPSRLLLRSFFIFALLVPATLFAAPPWEAADLNPVVKKAAPKHADIALVQAGKPLGAIVVMGRATGASSLQHFIKAATGAELPIVKEIPAGPAIVLGDCEQAAALGLDSAKMPAEGFAIKTAANQVYIVGKESGRGADGQQWGVNEFLERFVGVRWYFPPAVEDGPEIGQSIPPSKSLVVPATWIEDAPVFRMRVMWPPVSSPYNGSGIKLNPVQNFSRAGNSWPITLQVHQPNWGGYEELKKNRPGVFQLQKNGKRQYEVICYGHPQTVETYLEGIQNFLDKKKPLYAPITDKSITVSPYDVELACYCEHCQKLWDKEGGQYGGD